MEATTVGNRPLPVILLVMSMGLYIIYITLHDHTVSYMGLYLTFRTGKGAVTVDANMRIVEQCTTSQNVLLRSSWSFKQPLTCQVIVQYLMVVLEQRVCYLVGGDWNIFCVFPIYWE